MIWGRKAAPRDVKADVGSGLADRKGSGKAFPGGAELLVRVGGRRVRQTRAECGRDGEVPSWAGQAGSGRRRRPA